MQEEIITIEKKGIITIVAHRYDESDNTKLLNLFNTWMNYKNAGAYFKQRANTPEGLTESVVAKDLPNVYRKISVKKNKKGITKFDCYKKDTNEIIEVKGCSIPNDLTSWSPKPYFDFFCFVDFSSLDGKYKIFKININSEELKSLEISANETFQEQIDKKRRPRFSVYEKFITPKNRCTGLPIFEGDLNQ